MSIIVLILYGIGRLIDSITTKKEVQSSWV